MLIGAGALGASEEIMRVAELLDAGVAKALLGKAVLPDDLPFVTGAIGLLMCSSVPYAIAAKFAYPDRMPIAIVEEGTMQMLCMNELITIAKYWQSWKTLQFLILVVINQDLNIVTWEQRALAGDPNFENSQNLPDVQFAQFAKSLVLKGISIDHPENLTKGLDKAIASDRKKNFLTAMMKGEQDVREIIKQIYEEVKDEKLPQ